MKFIVLLSLAWVAGFLILICSGDFGIWVVPEPGHGQPWQKQHASPAAKVCWAILLYSGIGMGAGILFYGGRLSVRWLGRFNRPQRRVILVLLVAATAAATAAVIRLRQIPATPEHRRIATACLDLARLAPALPDHILQAADPRIPETLRAINPVQIDVTPRDVVVFVTGSLREYHFSQDRSDTNTWILYGALARTGRHVEILRIQGAEPSLFRD